MHYSAVQKVTHLSFALSFLLASVAAAQADDGWRHEYAVDARTPFKAQHALPLSDGGVLLDNGRRIIRLDAQGNLLHEASERRIDLATAVETSDGSIEAELIGNGNGFGVLLDTAPSNCHFDRSELGMDIRLFGTRVMARSVPSTKPPSPGRFGLSAGPDWEEQLSWYGRDCAIRYIAPALNGAPGWQLATATGEQAYMLSYQYNTLSLQKLNRDGLEWTWPVSIADWDWWESGLYGALDGGAYVSAGGKIEKFMLDGRSAWSSDLGVMRPHHVSEVGETIIAIDNMYLPQTTAGMLDRSPVQTVVGLDLRGEVAWRQQREDYHLRGPLPSAAGSGLWKRSEQTLVEIISRGHSLIVPFDEPIELVRLQSDGSATSVLPADENRTPLAELRDRRIVAATQQPEGTALVDPVTGAVQPLLVDGLSVDVHVQAIHVLAQGMVVFTNAAGVRDVWYLDDAGALRWRTSLSQGGDYSGSLTVRSFASDGRRLCLWGSRFGAWSGTGGDVLTCLDLADGSQRFDWRSLEGVAQSAFWMDLLENGDIRLMATTQLLQSSDSGSGTYRRALWERVLDRHGELLSEREVADVGLSQTFVRSTDLQGFWVNSQPIDDGCCDGAATQVARYRANGDQEWVANLDILSEAMAASSNDELLVIGTSNGLATRIIALRPDGSTHWSRDLPESDRHAGMPPTVLSLADGDWLVGDSYSCGRAPRLSKLRAADGSLAWQQQFDYAQAPVGQCASHHYSTVAGGDSVFVLTQGSGVEPLIVVDAPSGEIIEERDIHDSGSTASLSRRFGSVVADPTGQRFVVARGERSKLMVESLPFSVPAPAAVPPVQTALRGIWHSGVAEGQGFLFDVTNTVDAVFGAWFTFSAEGGHQPSELRWYSLQAGTTAHDDVATMQIYRHQTGRFALVADVQGELVGEAKLRLLDCNRAMFTYRFDASVNEGVSGFIPLQRTAGALEHCDPAPVVLRDPRAGSWFDPAANGQGLLFEAFPVADSPSAESLGLAGAWFTFDPDGAADDPTSQHWFTLQADAGGAPSLTSFTIYRTIGGRLGSGPTNNTWPVGRAELRLSDCSHASLSYQFNSDDVAGSFAELGGTIELSKLTSCTGGL